MTDDIEKPLSDAGKAHLKAALQYVEDWCQRHPWQVGLAEMALGAGLIAAGVESGAIEMGRDLVAAVLDKGTTAGLLGAAGGSFMGLLPGAIVKGVGVAALGTAISVPAVLLMGGGGLLLGLAGYGAGRLAHDFLQPVPDLATLIGGGSLLLVGTALLIDGARRLARTKEAASLAMCFRDGVLHLRRVSAPAFIADAKDLVSYLVKTGGGAVRELAKDPVGAGLTGAGMAAGAYGGSLLAASTVTVLGSKTLGGIALSLGLVSAPVWPVVLGAGATAAAGYGAWRFLKRRRRPTEPPPLPPMEPLRIPPA